MAWLLIDAEPVAREVVAMVAVTQIITAASEATVAILQGVGMFRRNRPQPAPPASVNNDTRFVIGIGILALTTAASLLGAALIIHHGLVSGGKL